MSGISSRWRPWLPRFWLTLFAVGTVSWLALLDYEQKISTDVGDLLPAHERQPEVQLLRSLVNETHARSLWFVLADETGGAPADAAVEAFLAALQNSAAIEGAERVDDGTTQRELAEHVFAQRFRLLLPQWLQERRNQFATTTQPLSQWPDWLANQVVEDLDGFLAQPESAAFEEILSADPLLLLPKAAAQASLLGGGEGAGPAAPALVWANSAAPPLAEAGQGPVFAAVEVAMAAALSEQPGLSLEWSGVHRFAAASKARIRAEVSWLNTASIIMVLVVTSLLVHRPWRVLHLLPVVLFALLGAWTVTTMAFDRIHILVFVLGALLTGAAIDYGFHLSVPRPGATGAVGWERLRPVFKPLLGSCLTTVIGFSLLWWSELPLLRQLGVFVTAGLLSALGAALLYFSHLPSASIEPRRSRGGPESRALRVAAGVAALAACVGLVRLEWHDDIRELEVPAVALQENDQRVRQFFGENPGRSAYMIRGEDLAEVRARLAAFTHWHEQQYQETPASVGSVLPTEEQHRAAVNSLQLLRAFPDALRRQLTEQGYDVAEFEPFFQAWLEHIAQPRAVYDDLLAEVVARLHGPWNNLGGATADRAWLLAFAQHSPSELPPPRLGVVELNQLRTLNRVFTQYRLHALELSSVGVLLVVGAVFLLYGLGRGVRVLMIPVIACLVTFGTLGWLGQPLNLFHLLGAFLGLCLSHDYAIFATEPRAPAESPPASVRLAALTTAASFGVLIFSRIPVISSLGVTVTMIVILSLLMVELMPLARPPRP